MERYKFNKEKLEFVKARRGLKWWGRKIIQYMVTSLLLALVYYLIFTLLFSTERERKIEHDNEVMAREYKMLQQKLEVLDNTVANLVVKDREIYRSIFDADPLIVSLSEDGNTLLNNIDTTKNEIIIEQSSRQLSFMEDDVDWIKGCLESIDKQSRGLGEQVRFVPCIIPVKDFSIGQAGASVGRKINPFYKTVREHTGMDLLGTVGTEVVATAHGIVELAKRSKTGAGNTVVLDHGNGYKTVYSHLGNIMARRGQRVKQGDVIGKIGMTGMSFAPHLHYEVQFNGKQMDPINYYFAEISPEQFRDMVALSSNTGQSLD